MSFSSFRPSLLRRSLLIAGSVLALSASAALAQPAGPLLDRGDAVVSGFAGIVPSGHPLAPGDNPLEALLFTVR